MKIQETIHHGDCHSVREVEMDNLALSRVAGMLEDCSYITVTPEKAGRIASDLAVNGTAEQGWVRWEVLPAEHEWESMNLGVHVYHYICRKCGLSSHMTIPGECDESEVVAKS